MRLKKREHACSLASSPTIAPIRLVSNRSLLGELEGYQTTNNNFIRFKRPIVFKQQTNVFSE
ncbi:hypothetical protein HPSH_00945 [Helicobacter pylori Shi470]|nr:hypothetical protein HPSH_00945 [Helicobacter pylori Shi470]